jgi:hypothetical protein
MRLGTLRAAGQGDSPGGCGGQADPVSIELSSLLLNFVSNIIAHERSLPTRIVDNLTDAV